MKSINKLLLGLLTLLGSFSGAYAITCGTSATPVERYTVQGNEVYCLDQSGNITSSGTITSIGAVNTSNGVKIGLVAPSAGAGGTGTNAGVKVVYVNSTGGTISQGMVVLASATTNVPTLAPGTIVAALSTTTWVGVADADLTAGSTGYMTTGGYALVLTTGTVTVGDIVTSTDSVAGYAGRIAPGTSVLEGSVIDKAMSQGTAAGGLTLIRVGN